jgi:hypothetical protein
MFLAHSSASVSAEQLSPYDAETIPIIPGLEGRDDEPV